MSLTSQALLREGNIDAAHIQDDRCGMMISRAGLLFQNSSAIILDLCCCRDDRNKLCQMSAEALRVGYLEEKEGFAFLWKSIPENL
jgi:hypothetical protein